MRRLIVIFILIVFNSAFSQDLYLKCGNRKIPCDNGNKDHFAMIIHCPYQETDTTKIPKTILDTARQYLLDRVGANFYNRIKFYSCQIIDFKKYNAIKKEKPFIDKEIADKRVKYALQYYFTVQGNMQYYLSLVYDKDGKFISEHFLPDRKTNKFFDKIIDVCKATQIIEADSIFNGQVEEIYLEFSQTDNSFVWIALKPNIYEGPKTIISRYIIINATTGQLIKRKTAKGALAYSVPSF